MTLDEIAEILFYTTRAIAAIEESYKGLVGRGMNTSLILNFRDALCHYKICYENFIPEDKKQAMKPEDIAVVTKIFITQEANLIEHINRSIKDGCTTLHNIYCSIITVMIDDHNLSCKDVNKFRKYLHDFKNCVLDIRYDGLLIADFDIGSELLKLKLLIANFEIAVTENAVFAELYLSAKNTVRNSYRKF